MWAHTVNGKRMPVDAEPDIDGNCRLEGMPPAIPAVHVLGPADLETYADRQLELHTSHFTTCPQRG